MSYRAFIGKIRKGKEEDYVTAHQAVWPELIEAMREAGVERESCFVAGNYIFVYVEGADVDTALRKLQNESVNMKWDDFMEPLLERPVEGCSHLFPEMTEVFKM